MPASNEMPLETKGSPAIDNGSRSARDAEFCLANSAAASTFTLPAPAPSSPAFGMNVLVSCSAAFASAGVSFGRSSSSSATAPLTTPAAMLVPDSWM